MIMEYTNVTLASIVVGGVAAYFLSLEAFPTGAKHSLWYGLGSVVALAVSFLWLDAQSTFASFALVFSCEVICHYITTRWLS